MPYDLDSPSAELLPVSQSMKKSVYMNGNKHPVEVAEVGKNKLRRGVSLYSNYITNLHKCYHHHPSYLKLRANW